MVWKDRAYNKKGKVERNGVVYRACETTFFNELH